MIINNKISEFLQSEEIIQTNWIVVTGAPCSGKTTTLKYLSEKGYIINPDISREYIASCIEKGIDNYDIRKDEVKLQEEIFKLMIENAMSLDPKKTIFLDYALPDNIAFHNVSNIKISNEIIQSANKFRYKTVFIFEPLEIIEDDVRIEDSDYQLSIDKELKMIYRSLNYEYFIIPKLPIGERANMILKQIK